MREIISDTRNGTLTASGIEDASSFVNRGYLPFMMTGAVAGGIAGLTFDGVRYRRCKKASDVLDEPDPITPFKIALVSGTALGMAAGEMRHQYLMSELPKVEQASETEIAEARQQYADALRAYEELPPERKTKEAHEALAQQYERTENSIYKSIRKRSAHEDVRYQHPESVTYSGLAGAALGGMAGSVLKRRKREKEQGEGHSI